MSKENYKTHTILQPKDCKCGGECLCNICDGGLSYCSVCKGGEIELEEQTCQERQAILISKGCRVTCQDIA